MDAGLAKTHKFKHVIDKDSNLPDADEDEEEEDKVF